MTLPLFLAAVCTLGTAARSGEVDLGAIEKKLVKEPEYEGDAPRYCLLALGPAAETRVWLVWDGLTLYVDRDGDGDLTAQGEKVAAEPDESDGRYVNFQAGDIADGDRLHRGLGLSIGRFTSLEEQDAQAQELLKQFPDARKFWLHMDVEFPGRIGIGLGGRVEQRVSQGDTGGYLQFASRPEDAPIVHFGGPLTATLYSSVTLRPGREQDVYLGLGTLGRGPGTTAWVGYEKLVPADVHPTIEITYPPASADSPAIKEKTTLDHRC